MRTTPPSAGRAAAEVIDDDEWLQGDFITTVQQRGAAIIAARGLSSAASAASAVIETVRNVAAPTGQIFSAAVPSPGEEAGYGVPAGIVFGYPLRGTGPGEIEIVQGISHEPWAAEQIAATLAELVEERDAVGALVA